MGACVPLHVCVSVFVRMSASMRACVCPAGRLGAIACRRLGELLRLPGRVPSPSQSRLFP
eukprot:9040234-Lingulodinium_polyedra.AAC.1